MNKVLTIIIPTLNEELNIVKCLEALSSLNCEIYVLDSCSRDRTVELSEQLGGIVIQKDWKLFSEKINWALNNLDVKTDWVMRLHADEVLSNDLLEILKSNFLLETNCDAFLVNRKVEFLGKILNFGGMKSLRDVRIWRTGIAAMEERENDEHTTIDGTISTINGFIIDRNNKDIFEWTDKHNIVSTHEAGSFMLSDKIEGNTDRLAKVKRFIRNNIYYKLPLFFRAALNFVLRYVILLGFLDGRAGLIFHVLQGFWYRFLVDVKIYESRLKDGSPADFVGDSQGNCG